MAGGIAIRVARLEDIGPLSHLRAALWPASTAAEHARELDLALASQSSGPYPSVVFVAETAAGELIGFLEAGLRSHADGCDPARPVGYIEGWFVAESHRKRGAGAQLVAAAEDWARRQGCLEIASDTWLDNEGSIRAHRALGYEEVDRCVNFRKLL